MRAPEAGRSGGSLSTLEVFYERLSYEMGFWNVEGAHAYAVIAGTLTVTIKGQTVVRKARNISGARRL